MSLESLCATVFTSSGKIKMGYWMDVYFNATFFLPVMVLSEKGLGKQLHRYTHIV